MRTCGAGKNKKIDSEQLFWGALISFLLSIYFFSPLLSWSISLIILGLLSKNLPSWARKLIGLIVVFSLATLVGSRGYGLDLADDFANNYYSAYKAIAAEGLSAVWEEAPVGEWGLFLFFYIISLLFGNTSPQILIFLVSFVTTLTYWIWLEKYGLVFFESKYCGLAVSLSFAMFGYGGMVQLTRQFLSTIFILFAIFNRQIKLKVFFLLVATLFHLTALPIYLTIYIIKRFRLIGMLLTVLSVNIIIYKFDSLAQFAIYSGIMGGGKFGFNIENTDGFTGVDLVLMKYFLITALASIFPIIVGRFKWDSERISWFYVFWSMFFIYLLFLPFSLLPLRLTLIINSLIIGWLIMYFLKGLNFKTLQIFFVIFLLIKSMSMIYQSPSDGLRLWVQFEPWGIVPGYFILSYLNP